MRRVVLLCGPPGAGKTTAARESGLEVFDRDDDVLDFPGWDRVDLGDVVSLGVPSRDW